MHRLTELMNRRDAGELTRDEFIAIVGRELVTFKAAPYPETDYGHTLGQIDYPALVAAVSIGRLTQADFDAIFAASAADRAAGLKAWCLLRTIWTPTPWQSGSVWTSAAARPGSPSRWCRSPASTGSNGSPRRTATSQPAKSTAT